MPERRKPFYGWAIVASMFAMLATSAGLGFYALSLYLRVLHEERGFSISSMSGATALFFVVSGATGLWVGKLIARYDPRPIIAVGTLVAAAALTFLGRVTELWQVYVLYGFFGFGFAFSGLVPGTTLVTRWFHRRRAVALSVASTGLSVGGIALTPFAASLIDDRGLREASPFLAGIYVALVIPITALVVRRDPARLGVRPDGDAAPPGPPPEFAAGVPYDVARRTRIYRAISAAWTLALLAQVGAIAHLVSLGADRADRATGTLCVSVLAAFSVMGRLVGGSILSRFSLRRFCLVLISLQGTALLVMAWAPGRTALLLASALFGVSVGNVLLLQPVVIAEVFGVRDYPRLYGLSQMISTIGVAGGPLLLGLLRDVAGGYGVAYAVAASASALGVAALALGGPLLAPPPVDLDNAAVAVA